MPILIDGHNLIGRMKSISLADPNDEAKLIDLLARHLLHRREKVIVIFDKGSGDSFEPRQKGPKLQIIFAPPEGSADAIIIDMIKQDPNPKGLTIVSSDNEIRRCARSRRARLMSAEEFAKRLESEPKSPRKRRRKLDEVDFEENIEDWFEYFQKGR